MEEGGVIISAHWRSQSVEIQKYESSSGSAGASVRIDFTY